MEKDLVDPVPTRNIVRDYYDGNTHVIICNDAYRGRSRKEQRESWKNLCRIASNALYNQQMLTPKDDTT